MDNKNNIGENNSGNWNSGNWNSGYGNSGYRNSGNWNNGDRNSGYGNSGNWNSGYGNSGNWNSGDGNSGYRNSGIFNTDEPYMRAFNKETKVKMSDWIDSDDYIYFNIPLNEVIYLENMTDKEKEEHPEHKTTGGYLKTLEYKEAWKEWWKENQDKKDKIKKLPNFDSKIFFEITGIEIDADDEVEKAIKTLEKAGKLKDGRILTNQTNT